MRKMFVGNVFALSLLAAKVYTAYRDAPDNYRNIADEVKSLQIMDNFLQRLQSTTLSDNDWQEAQAIVKGCQGVLEELNSFMEGYKGLTSSNKKSLVLRRVKFGAEDFATLRARLTSNTILLNVFIQRFDIPPINIEYIVLIFIAVTLINYTHGWTALLAYTAQRQKALVFVLLEAATLEKLTRSYVRAFGRVVLRQR